MSHLKWLGSKSNIKSLFQLVACGLTLCALCLPALGQQEYVGKYDLFVGYAYLSSPKISLGEPGVHVQMGMRYRTWVSLGLDYSHAAGDGMITPDLLPTALQQSLATQLQGLAALGRLPAGYTLKVPLRSETSTFAAGPQFGLHRWKYITPFIRPSIGAIREVATPRPGDAIATAIVQQLAPSGKKTDWTGFYGVGGGADINFTRNFGVRIHADFVRDHLFNDILRDSRGTIRFSVGPAFQWGKNMK